jgi:MFS transporter, ACS family, hexuronate transporter
MRTMTPGLRWALFGLLCVAGIFNAMDRPVIAILKPDMSADFGWTDQDFGNLASVTQMSAAIAFLFTGWLVDRLGVVRSMVAGVSTWSLAAISHGWAVTTAQAVASRVGLGATEAFQTPLTIKTVTALFSPDRRSFALGVATAIAGTGTISMPFLIPALSAEFGWRGAIIIGGVGGFVTLALWLWLARGVRFDDGSANEDSSAPQSDQPSRYGMILTNRQTWGIVIAKAISDSTWWLMGFWLPDFYRRTYGLTTEELAVPMAIAFLGSGAGALFAGWASTRLLERGWSVNRVRKTVMLVSALIVVPLPLVLTLDAFWPVAFMMGVVMAGHQGFSLSIFSTITDVVPVAQVGRVTAFGAFCGNMAGAGITFVTGMVLGAGLGFVPLFLFASVSYLLALGWFQLFLPTIRRHDDALAA